MSVDLKPGQWVKFRFLEIFIYTARLYEQDGCLFATTDTRRYGDEPNDILVRHPSGSLNSNISHLEVLP